MLTIRRSVAVSVRLVVCGVLVVLLAAACSGGGGSHPHASSGSAPPTTVAPAASITRKPVNTAIGDPGTADMCAVLRATPIRLTQLKMTFDAEQSVAGCNVTMYRGSTVIFQAAAFTQSVAPSRAPGSTTRRLAGLTEIIAPYDELTEACTRTLAFRGGYVSVVLLGVTRGSRDELCGATDQITAAVATAISRGPLPRLRLAAPSLTRLDECAVLHAAGSRPFTGTVQNVQYGTHCTLNAGSRSGNALYIGFEITPGPSLPGFRPMTVSGHRVYVNDSAGTCRVAYLGGRTPDGRQERLMFTTSPNDTPQKNFAPLCRDTQTVAARFLGTAGLP